MDTTSILKNDSIKSISESLINASLNQNTWTNNEIWTFGIAVLALLISFVLGYFQLKFSRKQTELGIKLDKFESQKGEIQLISIIIRFIIAFNSTWDTKNPKKAELKRDIVSIKQFIIECNSIVNDLTNLINNSFYIELIEKYPILVKMVVQLRRDVVEQDIKCNNDINNFALNSHTFTHFYDLFYILKKEQVTSEIFNRELVIELDEILQRFVKDNPSLLKR